MSAFHHKKLCSFCIHVEIILSLLHEMAVVTESCAGLLQLAGLTNKLLGDPAKTVQLLSSTWIHTRLEASLYQAKLNELLSCKAILPASHLSAVL